MADKNSPKKHGKSANARDERLKASLKANLARRNAQAKARGHPGEKAGQDEE